MTDFTPISAFIGGAFIGLSALILMLTIGKIAGCSGIITNIFISQKQGKSQLSWRLCFILGLALGPLISAHFSQFSIPSSYDLPLYITIAGALLVGIGAALGNGCTSGHGICGIGRLSKRSIAATATFMTSGFITVFIVRHLLEL